MTSPADDLAASAAGSPAPFTQDQVEQLVRGTFPEEAVAAVLTAFPRPSTRRRTRTTEQSPIAIDEAELERLAVEGVTPSAVKKRLDASERPESAAPQEPAADRPTRRPPGAGRAA